MSAVSYKSLKSIRAFLAVKLARALTTTNLNQNSNGINKRTELLGGAKREKSPPRTTDKLLIT